MLEDSPISEIEVVGRSSRGGLRDGPSASMPISPVGDHHEIALLRSKICRCRSSRRCCARMRAEVAADRLARNGCASSAALSSVSVQARQRSGIEHRRLEPRHRWRSAPGRGRMTGGGLRPRHPGGPRASALRARPASRASRRKASTRHGALMGDGSDRRRCVTGPSISATTWFGSYRPASPRAGPAADRALPWASTRRLDAFALEAEGEAAPLERVAFERDAAAREPGDSRSRRLSRTRREATDPVDAPQRWPSRTSDDQRDEMRQGRLAGDARVAARDSYRYRSVMDRLHARKIGCSAMAR